MARPPLYPRHPERVCWGCDRYCPANDMACGNGSIRAAHPIELFGEDWLAEEEARGESCRQQGSGSERPSTPKPEST